jgi:hypothetical protein
MGLLMVIWVGATWMEFITTGITFVCDLAGGQLQEVFWRLKYERREEVLRPTDLDRRADSSERSRLRPCWPRFGVLRLGMLIDNISTNRHIHWTDPLDRAVMQPDMSGCVLNRPTFGSVKPSHSPAQPSISSQAQFQAPWQPRKFWFWIWNPTVPWFIFIPIGWDDEPTYIWSMHITYYIFFLYIYNYIICDLDTRKQHPDLCFRCRLWCPNPTVFSNSIGWSYLSFCFSSQWFGEKCINISNPRSTAHLNMFSSKSSTTISHAFLYVYIYII